MSTAFKTDAYELTQAYAYYKQGLTDRKAVFEVFARRLPEGRRYGVVSGTNRLLEAIQEFRFTPEQISYLKENTNFSQDFLEYLSNYSFNGEIIGYQEGDVYFPYSPILTVKGTFIDSVLLETITLSILNHDSAVSSAATRMVAAAKGKPLLEMGTRRTDDDAAVHSARAAYLSGFAGTSNLEASHKYGIPFIGTSAHAFTLAFQTELESFQAQIEALGEETTLLVDTYNIQEGIKNAVKAGGKKLGGIRIDSGDLQEETINARKLLDKIGNKNTKIVLSSDIDEYSINELIDRNIPVDSIGAGTRVVTGSGHPTASMVYKLVEIENNEGKMLPVAKKSDSKQSIGGQKHAYRQYKDGKLFKEVFTTDKRRPEGFTPVQRLLYDGKPIFTELENVRKFHQETIEKLPKEALLISAGKPLTISEEL